MSSPSPAADAARARAAYDALERHFAARHHLLREVAPRHGGPRYAYEWPYSQALAAALDLCVLDRAYLGFLDERLAGLERYWDARPAAGMPAYASTVGFPLGPGGRKFYDDNAWAGLALARVHRLTGNPAALALAREVFAFVSDGWAHFPPGAPHGGVYWVRQHPGEPNSDRNTVSNAPNAILALRLHAATGDPAYLAWAERLHGWVEEHLRDPADGLYWDHLTHDDTGAVQIDTTKWSYNQGTMIGAKALLHRHAPDAGYVARAADVARAALRHFDGRYATQDPAFNTIFFRNLLALHPLAAASPAARAAWDAALDALRARAERIWTTRREPRTGLFRFGPAGDPARLIDQAAATSLFAFLAADPADYDLLV